MTRALDGLKTPDAFTVAQIARSLSRSRQAVHEAVAALTPCGVILQDGKPLRTYRFCELPESLRVDLLAGAQKSGLEVLQFIRLASDPWRPRIPLASLHMDCIDEAHRLQTVLERIMPRLASPALSGPDRAVLINQAADELNKSPKQTRRLIDRTIERDRGLENWCRLEVYLPERLYRKASTAPATDLEAMFPDLTRYLTSTAGKQLTREVELAIWVKAIDAASAGQSKILISRLLYSKRPDMATGERAMLKALNRRQKTFLDGGGRPSALEPKHFGRPRGPKFTEQDCE